MKVMLYSKQQFGLKGWIQPKGLLDPLFPTSNFIRRSFGYFSPPTYFMGTRSVVVFKVGKFHWYVVQQFFIREQHYLGLVFTISIPS